MDETYAMQSATISILDALFPSLVIEGAINPIMISGTQKLMNCPTMYLTHTSTFSTAAPNAEPSEAFSASPTMIPKARAHRSLNGKL